MYLYSYLVPQLYINCTQLKTILLSSNPNIVNLDKMTLLQTNLTILNNTNSKVLNPFILFKHEDVIETSRPILKPIYKLRVTRLKQSINQLTPYLNIISMIFFYLNVLIINTLTKLLTIIRVTQFLIYLNVTVQSNNRIFSINLMFKYKVCAL